MLNFKKCKCLENLYAKESLHLKKKKTVITKLKRLVWRVSESKLILVKKKNIFLIFLLITSYNYDVYIEIFDRKKK